MFERKKIAALVKNYFGQMSGGIEVSQKKIESSGKHDRCLLSYSQQQLWLLHQLNPDNVAYNVHDVMSVKGDIDDELLRQALDSFLEKYTLR